MHTFSLNTLNTLTQTTHKYTPIYHTFMFTHSWSYTHSHRQIIINKYTYEHTDRCTNTVTQKYKQSPSYSTHPCRFVHFHKPTHTASSPATCRHSLSSMNVYPWQELESQGGFAEHNLDFSLCASTVYKGRVKVNEYNSACSQEGIRCCWSLRGTKKCFLLPFSVLLAGLTIKLAR